MQSVPPRESENSAARLTLALRLDRPPAWGIDWRRDLDLDWMIGESTAPDGWLAAAVKIYGRTATVRLAPHGLERRPGALVVVLGRLRVTEEPAARLLGGQEIEFVPPKEVEAVAGLGRRNFALLRISFRSGRVGCRSVEQFILGNPARRNKKRRGQLCIRSID